MVSNICLNIKTMILFLLLLNLIISPVMSVHFCYTNRRLDNILTIGDYVLIGSDDSNYWVWDQTKDEFLENQTTVTQLFNGDFESVLFVSSITSLTSDVINSESNRKSLNLVIAIGLLDSSKTLGLMTYRYHRKPLSLLRIENSNELPPDWELDSNGEFADNLGNFWPKNPLSDETDSQISGPQIKSFNYFSPKRLFLINIDSNPESYLVKGIESEGQLNAWMPINLQIDSKHSNRNCLKLFEFNEKLFTFCEIKNELIIGSELSLIKNNGVLNLSANPVNITTREFFDCKRPRNRAAFEWLRNKTTTVSPESRVELTGGPTDPTITPTYSGVMTETSSSREESLANSQTLTTNYITKDISDIFGNSSEETLNTSKLFETKTTKFMSTRSPTTFEEEISPNIQIRLLLYLVLIYLTAAIITFTIHLLLNWDIDDMKRLTKVYKQYFRAELGLETNALQQSFKLKKIKYQTKQK